MREQVFLAPVKAVHADDLHGAETGMRFRQRFQKAQQGRFPRAGRGREQDEHASALLRLQIRQMPEEREEKFLHRALFIVRCGVDSVDSNAVFHALHLLLSAPRHDKRGHFLWYSSVPPDAWEGYQIAGRM